MTTKADRVTMPGYWRWVLCAGGGLLGVGLGFGIPPFVSWAAGTLPLPGPVELAAEIPTGWLVPILAALGVVGGFFLSAQAQHDALAVTVDDASIITERQERERYIARADIAAVFTDGKDFVVTGRNGQELFRDRARDTPIGPLGEVLRRRGYPWMGTSDPNEAQFKRWVEGHPDLDDKANRLLRARRKAREAKDHATTTELAADLAEQGVIVRDRDKKQQYRVLAT